MVLKTRKGVEIARTGKWQASTGEWTCTRSQLAAAVRAQHHTAFRTPVVKPGHKDPGWDGGPALGQVTNLRTTDDGNVLLGDLVIPEWLDTAMPSAYPSRSVEALLAATTPDGESFEMVVTGLALLGVTPPAIQSLAELEQNLTEHVGSYVAAMAISASAGDTMDAFPDVEAAGSWNEGAHARGAKGSSSGGKFVSKGSGYTSQGKASQAGDVKKLQQQLIRLGFLGAHDGKGGHGVDGLFGPKTEAAVRAMQKANGIKVTGHLSAADIAALAKQPTPGTSSAAKSAGTAALKKVLKSKVPAKRKQWTDGQLHRKPGRLRRTRANGNGMSVAAAYEIAAGDDSDQIVREVWSDTVIVDDDAGRLWSVPWSEDETAYQFGDPVRVHASYTAVEGVLAASLDDARIPLYSARDRAAPSPKEQHQVDSTLLRERLIKAGATVPEDATDEQMLAAMDAVLDPENSLTATDASRLPTVTRTGSTGDSNHEPIDVGALVAAAVAEATAPFTATITDLGTQLANRNAADAATTKATVLQAAQGSGKFKPADLETWSKRYDAAPGVTTEILASLPAGVAVPVSASGHVSATEDGAGDVDTEWAQIAASLGLPAGDV